MVRGARVLVFIGTDGSGKSTLAKRVAAECPLPACYAYFGLKEFRFGLAARRFERYGDKSRWFRYLLLPIEYWLRRRDLPRCGFIVLDRIPGWAFAGRSPLLHFIYRWVLPRTDTLILCTGTPELIAVRKGERDTADCARDMAKWESVYRRYPARRRLRLDTTAGPADDTVVRILREVVRDPSRRRCAAVSME